MAVDDSDEPLVNKQSRPKQINPTDITHILGASEIEDDKTNDFDTDEH